MSQGRKIHTNLPRYFENLDNSWLEVQGIHTMGFCPVSQRNCLWQCYHHLSAMQPSAQCLTPWLPWTTAVFHPRTLPPSGTRMPRVKFWRGTCKILITFTFIGTFICSCVSDRFSLRNAPLGSCILCDSSLNSWRLPVEEWLHVTDKRSKDGCCGM
jgi:hypothetical protein